MTGKSTKSIDKFVEWPKLRSSAQYVIKKCTKYYTKGHTNCVKVHKSSTKAHKESTRVQKSHANCKKNTTEQKEQTLVRKGLSKQIAHIGGS